GADGTSGSVILIASGDEDLGSVGGGGNGERGCVVGERDGGGGSIAHVEEEHGGNVLGDDYYLGAVGNELRIDRREIALAEVVGLHGLGKIHRRSNVHDGSLTIADELSIGQRYLGIYSEENVDVRRIEREHVLSVRRNEDLKRDAGGGYEVE